MIHIHFPTIDSTNAYLKEHYASLENLTFVSADYQSRGKGRLDRVWEASQGENLLFSVLLRKPDLSLGVGFFSLLAAFAVAETLEDMGLSDVQIKWPNDVYAKDKKITGILLEGSLPEYLVIGVGINVNQTTFPTGLRHEPTSVALQLESKVDLSEFRDKIFAEFESLLSKKPDEAELLTFYNTHDYLIGKRVAIGDQEGEYAGVDNRFGLRLNTGGGVVTILSGEISE